MPVIYCFLRSEGCVKSWSKLARFFLPHKADQSVWRRLHARSPAQTQHVRTLRFPYRTLEWHPALLEETFEPIWLPALQDWLASTPFLRKPRITKASTK